MIAVLGKDLLTNFPLYPQIRLFDILIRDEGAGVAACHNSAVFQDVAAPRGFEGLAHVLLNKQDGHAFPVNMLHVEMPERRVAVAVEQSVLSRVKRKLAGAKRRISGHQ